MPTTANSTTFAPADYLRVILRGERGTSETLTDRSGQFIFEDVPAGLDRARITEAYFGAGT